MIDHSRIEDRISEIRKRLRQLKETAESVKPEDFYKEDQIIDATERRIQLVIQACMDIASHIVAQMALEKPKKENKEVFTILAKHSILTPSIADRLSLMAGMRNILVHDYLEVDTRKIFNVISHDLKDIEEFVVEVQRFLDKQMTK